MKILFTGGGSGGHFYPIIAIAEEVNDLVKQERLLEAKLYYMSNTPFNERMLYDNNIIYLSAPAGKVRRYFSIKNFFDMFKTATGIIKAVWRVFTIFPDVVLGKGGYASFPALVAARLFRIPVIIHESDSTPGRVNLWASKFARKIAISYPEVAEYFPKEKVAYTGNPIRKSIQKRDQEGAVEFLKLEKDIPLILILGGSQGAQAINDALLDSIPKLIEKYQIIHQTGVENFEEVRRTVDVIVGDNPNKSRYKAFPYINDLAMQMSASIAELVISRAGSSIFEIANWGIPSIIIPIPETVSHDQTSNAFNYARSGACIVIEEVNLSPNIVLHEINKLMDNSELRRSMSESALKFAPKDASQKIARALLDIALQHEK